MHIFFESVSPLSLPTCSEVGVLLFWWGMVFGGRLQCFAKASPPFLANLLRSLSLIVLVGHDLWGKAAIFCKSVSPLPCSLALKTCVVYTIISGLNSFFEL